MRAGIIGIAAYLLAAGPAPARAAEPVKIGAILAVTGPAAFLGEPEARTLEMLAQELNAKGGIGGRPVAVLLRDSQGSPEKAVSFAKELIEEQKVLAIVGPTTSGETMAIKGIAEEGRTLLVSLAAAEVIVQPVAKHVFKVAPMDRFAVEMIFGEMKRRGIGRIGVLSSNTGFGKAGKEQVEKLAPGSGIVIAADEVYDKAATDLTAEVTKVAAARVQAILNWSIEPAQSIVIKNARQLGLTIPIFQSHGFANVQYARRAGAAAEGVIFPAGRLVVADSLPPDHPQRALLERYKAAYEARYHDDVSTFGGHAYDAFTLLVHAVRAAGTDPERVRDAVEGTRGFVGTGGIFNFSPADHNGLGIDAFEMVTVRDGRFVPLSRK